MSKRPNFIKIIFDYVNKNFPEEPFSVCNLKFLTKKYKRPNSSAKNSLVTLKLRGIIKELEAKIRTPNGELATQYQLVEGATHKARPSFQCKEEAVKREKQMNDCAKKLNDILDEITRRNHG